MLSEQHRTMLEQESGISPEIIEARGYRSITAREAAAYGFTGQQAQGGLLIPVHTTDGEMSLYVLRPDAPRVVEDRRRKKDAKTGERPQRVVKYEWPRGVDPRVDCPPLGREKLKDAAVPLCTRTGKMMISVVLATRRWETGNRTKSFRSTNCLHQQEK